MRVVYGLGNPGKRYTKTRHNVGFMVLDRLADRFGGGYSGSRFQAEVCPHRIDSLSIMLAKPQTFMNESGRAVGGLNTFYDVALDDMLVICDDLDLPLGRLRLRPKGGSGGQKGLKSISRHVSSQEFARLRIGIGRDSDMDPSHFVLRPFAVAEQEVLETVLETAADAAECWLTEGISAAMNRFNIKPAPAPRKGASGDESQQER